MTRGTNLQNSVLQWDRSITVWPAVMPKIIGKCPTAGLSVIIRTNINSNYMPCSPSGSEQYCISFKNSFDLQHLCCFKSKHHFSNQSSWIKFHTLYLVINHIGMFFSIDIYIYLYILIIIDKFILYIIFGANIHNSFHTFRQVVNRLISYAQLLKSSTVSDIFTCSINRIFWNYTHTCYLHTSRNRIMSIEQTHDLEFLIIKWLVSSWFCTDFTNTIK